MNIQAKCRKCLKKLTKSTWSKGIRKFNNKLCKDCHVIKTDIARDNDVNYTYNRSREHYNKKKKFKNPKLYKAYQMIHGCRHRQKRMGFCFYNVNFEEEIY